MRIRLTLDIRRSRPAPEPEEPRPSGDVYADTERAEYTRGPQIGFQREEPYWEEDDRGRRRERR